MDFRHICTAAMIAKHDLETSHKALSEDDVTSQMRLVLMRHLISELANVADLANISGALYKEHRELGELHKPIRRGLEFFKYLRNQYVGHFVSELTEKTFEWIPHSNAVIGSGDIKDQHALSFFALETAINTYADEKTGHKLFETDTDLMYPPDHTRFLNFLGDTVVGALLYLDKLIAISRACFETPDMKTNWMEQSIVAGQTDFSVLTKKKKR